NQRAAVGAAADQASEALLERDGGLRNLVIVKRIAARLAHAADAGLDHGVAGNRERQAVDDDAAQLVARHVDTLPERGRREEDTVGRGAEFVEQRAAGARALDQSRIVDRKGDAIVD